MLGEMSETQKGKYCMIHFDKISRMGKLMEKENRDYQGLVRVGNGKVLFNGYRVSILMKKFGNR